MLTITVFFELIDLFSNLIESNQNHQIPTFTIIQYFCGIFTTFSGKIYCLEFYFFSYLFDLFAKIALAFTVYDITGVFDCFELKKMLL